MAVDRIFITNAPNSSIGVADRYQFAVGMYAGADESSTPTEPLELVKVYLNMRLPSHRISMKR